MAIFFIVIFSIILLQPLLAIETGLEATATTAGFETGSDIKDPTEIIASIINTALGLVGTLFLIFIIVSGFQWMLAGGNAETITKAKKRIINATIGLIIILSAYAITWFITTKALGVTGIAILK